MSGIGTPTSYSLETFRNKKGPLIDIRSPKEFSQGHWPGATNLPLFTDDERALIGTAYKRKGRNKAIVLGLEITKPKLSTLKASLENKSKEKELSDTIDSYIKDKISIN